MHYFIKDFFLIINLLLYNIASLVVYNYTVLFYKRFLANNTIFYYYYYINKICHAMYFIIKNVYNIFY